jgi:nucleotide-binding universal stress UspA family protein
MTAADAIVIAYDGSASARHAIAVAGALLGAGPAHVVYAWESLPTADRRLTVYIEAATLPSSDRMLEEELAGEQHRAFAVVAEGVALARAAGFDAGGEALHYDGPPAAALVRELARRAPRLAVLGSHGRSGIAAALHGSVARHVVAHARVPLLIVPPELT